MNLALEREIHKRKLNRDRCMEMAHRLRGAISAVQLRTLVRVARSYNSEAVSLRQMMTRMERRKQ